MEAKVIWKEKMAFVGESAGHSVVLDAKSPIGNGSGFTPKELLAFALCGCTGMDVVALMRKYKQALSSFEVRVEAPVNEGHPGTFKSFTLVFDLKGDGIESARAVEAVELSQSRYCAVSAMLSKAAPVKYVVMINDQEVSRGDAHFS